MSKHINTFQLEGHLVEDWEHGGSNGTLANFKVRSVGSKKENSQYVEDPTDIPFSVWTGKEQDAPILAKLKKGAHVLIYGTLVGKAGSSGKIFLEPKCWLSDIKFLDDSKADENSSFGYSDAHYDAPQTQSTLSLSTKGPEAFDENDAKIPF